MLPRPEWQPPGPMMTQAPGAGMPGADPFEMLENSRKVQADLGLTPQQLEKLHIASGNFHSELAQLLYPQPGVSPEQQRAAIQQHVANTRALIAQVLMPAQLHRLQQIMLQIEGPCLATLDSQVAHNLGLNVDQAEALSAACRGRDDKMRSAFRPPAPGENFCAAMAKNRDRIGKIRAHADQDIVAMLQPSQRIELKRMMGTPIHLNPPMPPNCRL